MELEFLHSKDSTSIQKTIINKKCIQIKIKRCKRSSKSKIRKSLTIDSKKSGLKHCEFKLMHTTI